MFFKAGRAGDNSWYWYLLTIIITGIGYAIIGAIPLVIAAVLKGMSMEELADTSLMPSYFENKNVLLALMLFIFIPTAALFWLGVTKFHRKPFLSVLTGFKSFRWGRFKFAFILGFLLVAISSVVSYYLSPEDYIFQFDLAKFIPLVLVAFIMIPIQAGWEEAFFRGYLMQGVSYIFGNRFVGLILTSLLFGALHLANPEVVEHGVATMFPIYAGMGLIFGLLVVLDNGLELAMGFHIANNIGLSLFATSPESVLQTDALFQSKTPMDPSGQALQLLVFGAILIAVLGWKYKWTDWKHNLLGSVSAKGEIDQIA